MESVTSRRSFLKIASALTLGVFDTQACVTLGQPSRRATLPKVDGIFLDDAATRRSAADDWGHAVERLPSWVLRPASIDDVARAVRYANDSGLPIAAKGRGHCAYGQAQVHNGIVIDSRTLNRLELVGHDQLLAEAGALWDDVATMSLSAGRIPPVMPDMQLLSVGGTLSAGGTGETSCRFGAQVDHVTALDVATGGGEIVSCSPSQNEELFRMTLAGMGQCGLIVRARLQLDHAPDAILVHRLLYEDVRELLDDAEQLARETTFETIGAELSRGVTDWKLELVVGSFERSAEPTTQQLPSNLRFKSDAIRRMSYLDYLQRRSVSVRAALATRQPNAPLILTLPPNLTRALVADVLANPEQSVGVWRMEILPMVTALFKQPLHPMPDGGFAFSVRVQRRASARNAPDHLSVLAANDALVRTYVAQGGKVYPPFAPPLTEREWRLNYGRVWKRFAEAKRRYDPNNILTPGARIFENCETSARSNERCS